MKLGITASRFGISPRQMEAWEVIAASLNVTHLYQGACLGGDEEMTLAFVRVSIANATIIALPSTVARWRSEKAITASHFRFDAKDPLVRDSDIVDRIDLLVAAPRSMTDTRGGTWATIRMARERGIPVIILDR